jgi:polysaccharide biosynthesis transport protein
MKLIQLIKLLQRHILLIILVPLLMMIAVYAFTRQQARSYQSETTIYTGIMSGYSVQQNTRTDVYASNTAYDNLINLIKSRNTLEEVSVRLLVQHLFLNHYDPKFIQQENYEELMATVPPDILQIVRRYKRNATPQQHYKPPSQSSYYNRQSQPTSSEGDPTASPTVRDAGYKSTSGTYSQGAYEASKDHHIVQRGETMYSIAKKYRMSIQELMNLNNLSSYELSTGQKINVSQATSALSQDLTKDYPYPSPARTSSSDTFQQEDYYRDIDTAPLMTRRWITLDVAHKAEKDTTTPYERCVRALINYGNANDYNFIYKLWSSNNDFYSIKALQNVSVTRIEQSDLLLLQYVNPDPGICQQTLIILTEVFIRNYKELRTHRTDAVVAYFKKQLEEAMRRLQRAEYDLLLFNERNKIINYYEQTKAIAGMKENLDQEYAQVQIAYASADAALKMIEKKLEAHARLSINTNAIMMLREDLSQTTMAIANIEIDLGNDSTTIKQLQGLKDHAAEIKKEIQRNLDNLYIINNSVEGLPTRDLLIAWLDNVIAYEESKAALRVLAERKRQFQRYYEIFAPLGAEMKRIERLIGVTEDEFLQLLHDLNLAKLRQQDDEMSTNIKVLDPPYYPLKPLATRTMFLILLAGVAGFVLVLAILIAMEYFDTTIKTPDRAEKYIKLKVAGIFPKITQKFYSHADMEFIIPRLVEMMAQNIKLALTPTPETPEKKPYRLLLFSILEGEGKTTIGRELTNKLRSFGEQVLYLNYFKVMGDGTETYMSESSVAAPAEDEVQYEVNDEFFEIDTLEQLVPGFDLERQEQYNFIIVEIPAIMNNPYPIDLIRHFDLDLLVVRANRSWKEADTTLLDSFKTTCITPPQIILNGVELYFLDSVFGDVPKPRSEFRRMIKRILLFRFREKTRVN